MEFSAWLDLVFGHADPDWFFALEAETPALPPAEAAAHILHLLDAPGETLAPRTDTQIAGGLRYLFDYMSGFAEARAFGHPSVATADRVALATRIDRLWFEVFAPRCAPALGHLSEEASPLNTMCYMFWDSFHGIEATDPTEKHTPAFIEAMGRILALAHPACQESALHGLGHWGDRDPDRHDALIGAFLAEDRAARPELIGYARATRAGCVL